MLKQSSSRSLLAPAAEGTSPKVRWGQDVNLDDKEEVEEEIGGASISNPEEVLEKQDTEVNYHLFLITCVFYSTYGKSSLRNPTYMGSTSAKIFEFRILLEKS